MFIMIGFHNNFNMSILKGDSLLSNISNISVKIQNNRFDGPQYFARRSQWCHQQGEIKIQELPDEMIQMRTLEESRVYLKKAKDMEENQESMRWIQSQSALNHGISEEDNDEKELVNPIIQEEDLKRNLKNETKNIPKNYGKAIITFIEKYPNLVIKVTKQCSVNTDDFLYELKFKKRNINTIADLRNLWTQNKYSKCMRILSNLFFRKYALQYIFNSRICNYGSHIKYRHRLRQAIKNPNLFKHIKDY